MKPNKFNTKTIDEYTLENVEKIITEKAHDEWITSMDEQIDALKDAIWLESQGMHSEYDY